MDDFFAARDVEEEEEERQSGGSEEDECGDDEERERQRQQRRRTREVAFQSSDATLTKVKMHFSLVWPCHVFEGGCWFSKSYNISGIGDVTVGEQLATTHGKSKGHTFYLKVNDARGNTLYGSYENYAAFERRVRGAVADGGLSSFLGVAGVTFENVKQYRDDTEAQLMYYELSGASELWLRADHSQQNLIVGMRWNPNKRQCFSEDADCAGMDLPTLEPDCCDVIDASWCDPATRLTCQEFVPEGHPCRLSTVFTDIKSEADANYLLQHLADVLELVFEEGSMLVGSNMEDVVFDLSKLQSEYKESSCVLMVVYNDSSFYFENHSKMKYFWRYVLCVLMTKYEKDTELLKLEYLHRDRTFRRKSTINPHMKPQASIDWRASNGVGVGVVEEEELEFEALEGGDDARNVCLVVGQVSADVPPVAVEKLNYRTAAPDVIELETLVKALRTNVNFPNVTVNSFRTQAMRNRILFEHNEVPVCLYLLNEYNHNYVEAQRAQSRGIHEPWITLGHGDKIRYNCSCNVSCERPQPMLELETVVVRENHEALSMNNDELSVDGYYHDRDYVVKHALEGLTELLAFWFGSRVKYVPLTRMFYYWDGELWVQDLDRLFLTNYVTSKVTLFLERAVDIYDSEGNKPYLKMATFLFKRFTGGDGAARNVLDMLRYYVKDDEFDKKRMHQGMIAASRSVVDLESGHERDYRFGDYISEKCKYNYDACDCGQEEHCFTNVRCTCSKDELMSCPHPRITCNARCAEDMMFVNEIIKEACGATLKQYVWRDQFNKVRTPVDESSKLCKLPRVYRNLTTNKDYETVPRGADPVDYVLLTRSVEYKYEDDGMRNFWRFVWTVGYVLSGYANRKLFVFCFGLQNNGKSLTWNALMEVFEPYLGAMDSSCVYGRNKLDDSATPALIQVVGKRGGVVPETAKRARLNDQALKMFTGGDSFTGRRMRSENEKFHLNLVPIVSSNVIPTFDMTDGALCDRLHPLEFPVTFVRPEDYKGYMNQRIRDESYPKLLATQRFKVALFNWGVRAARYYMEHQGKIPLPSSVASFKNDIKNANNPVPTFISASDRYEMDRAGKVLFKEFYTDLREYCRKELPEFKFDSPEKFRSLLRDLKSGGATDLDLSGVKNSADEYIVGVMKLNEY